MLGMTLVEYIFLALSSLFVIVDPIAVAPGFLAMSANNTIDERVHMARLACWVMAGVLLTFTIGGEYIFKFLGITMPAFQMAGSIVLLLIALDMLRAQRSPVQETKEETMAGVAKDDIAITPLAVPMLAGPGAISTGILLHKQAVNNQQRVALYLCILLVAFCTYLVLRISARSSRWLSPIALKLTTRIMGLLLAAVAFQFLVNALKELRIVPS
jgi:multiple antibiotic resistance protein